MAKRMLIDAAHPEETRVVVTSGTRLEDFDFESSTKKQVKGNIYLAKVTRVEPSLQAAFIDYGGNRHGFLAFSEIHPDYYRIPVGDRRADDFELLPGDGAAAETAGEDAGVPLANALPEPVRVPNEVADDETGYGIELDEAAAGADDPEPGPFDHDAPPAPEPAEPVFWVGPAAEDRDAAPASDEADDDAAAAWDRRADETGGGSVAVPASAEAAERYGLEAATIALRLDSDSRLANDPGELAYIGRGGVGEPTGEADGAPGENENVETFGGDEVEEVEEADADERRRYQPGRHYKIQEVIKRRQIMLVQVAKEERGNKGAALTTYLSLAGRYCVLMPNTNRGGGVSRKITSIADRRRLKDILEDLEIPEGMGVIVRTAGGERSKAEIKRDYEYLLRLWNEIRDLTLKSTAPALIYEEGNLIKRSIRDLYARDIDEVLVEGEEAYKTAKAFMRTLMPSHAKRVQPYRDPQIGLFHRFQIETQIDAIHSPVAQLRSGGYLVINQTEALVAIDVNSGRSTRERNIEETALRTNIEAAEEIARQLRLRDLAGLIVIDFIDMEEHRNQIAVERRLKDALKNDRARIQVGRISPFGLLEMSRQRLRPSLAEASTQPCPHCGGTGFIRSVESTALHVLRSIEEEGIRRRAAEICIYVPINVALYMLNQKRESLNQIESRYGIKVVVARDDSLVPPAFRLERLRPFGVGEAPPLRTVQAPSFAEQEEEKEEEEAAVDASETTEEAAELNGDERGRRRRPRRRRRIREPREAAAGGRDAGAPSETAAGDSDLAAPAETAAAHDSEAAARDSDADRRRRRRGRRGGRPRPHREEAADGALAEPVAAEAIEVVPSAEEPEAADAAYMPLPEPETWAYDEVGIETASLAPLAGEAAAPPPAIRAEPARDSEPQPTAEAEEGVPFVSDGERVLEEAGADAASPPQADPDAARSRQAEDVLTVGERPANPRRGWWQRLTQS
ncbi:MAG TPA: Rne/Rng family ribonuclease [Stellaceae bacterium]|nr:Rne/Rng family ribonuclease [Stellaceae bacterium]